MSLLNTYAADDYWRKYLPFLPEVMRLPQDPVEEWHKSIWIVSMLMTLR